MRRQGLHSRLERLERRLVQRPFPRVVFGIFDHADDEVCGVEADGVTVLRKPGEPIADLHCRAFAMTGALILCTLYAARQSAKEGASERPSATAPMNAPDAPVWPSVGDAGVGKIADRATLERIGAVAVPIERLV